MVAIKHDCRNSKIVYNDKCVFLVPGDMICAAALITVDNEVLIVEIPLDAEREVKIMQHLKLPVLGHLGSITWAKSENRSEAKIFYSF